MNEIPDSFEPWLDQPCWCGKPATSWSAAGDGYACDEHHCFGFVDITEELRAWRWAEHQKHAWRREALERIPDDSQARHLVKCAIWQLFPERAKWCITAMQGLSIVKFIEHRDTTPEDAAQVLSA